MQIPPIQTTNSPTFGHSHELKTLYKKGKIPISKGFYGQPISRDTVTIEHLRPVSKNGKTKLDNIVLASANSNQARGNKPLKEVIDYQAMGEYLDFFKNKTFGTINGNDYIQKVLNTVQKLLKENI